MLRAWMSIAKGSPMADDDFDFTFEELYRAFRLVTSKDDAAAQARQVVGAMRPGMDWSTTEQVMLLLSIGSPSGYGKVRRIRQAEQEGRFSTWRMQSGGDGTSPEELTRRWADLLSAEDTAWERTRAELQSLLREQGRLPPDP